jgi:hypothetical protein
MEGLLQYHPKAFDGPFLMNHVIPSLQNVLVRTLPFCHTARWNYVFFLPLFPFPLLPTARHAIPGHAAGLFADVGQRAGLHAAAYVRHQTRLLNKKRAS